MLITPPTSEVYGACAEAADAGASLIAYINNEISGSRTRIVATGD